MYYDFSQKLTTIFLLLLLTSGIVYAIDTNKDKRQAQLVISAAKSFADTGLLTELVKRFKASNPAIEIKINSIGSIQALEQVRKAQADIVISHFPEEEKRLLQQGFASRLTQLVHSQFSVFGPPPDKFQLSKKKNIFEVLKVLAAEEVAFVVPSTQGGTYRKIEELWALAGINPDWPDYEYTELSVLAALKQAAEFKSYVIADMGVYLANKDKLSNRIIPVYQNDLALENIYSVLLVNKNNKHTLRYRHATQFYDYLVSDKGQNDIYQVNKTLLNSALVTPAVHLDPRIQALKMKKKLEQEKLQLIYIVVILVVVVVVLLAGFLLFRRMQESEKKRAEGESRYQVLVETTPDWVWEIDNTNKLTYSNPRIKELLGYSEEDVAGLLITSLVDSPDRKKFSDILSEKNAFYNLECSRIHKDKNIIITEVSAVPVNDEDGDFKGYRGIERDITKRKATEIESLRLQREIQQSHKMESIGQLTGGIAHDFNNILGAILGYTQLADNKNSTGKDEKLAEYLTQIKKAGFRAKDLVAQMLAFSRGDNSNDHPIQFKPVIEEALSMLTSTLPASILIETKLDDGVPDVVLTKTPVQQLLFNLAINARDAMNEQGVLTIGLSLVRNVNTECTVSHKTIKGDWVVLSISDTGQGIAEENIKHIFNPFFTTKEVGKGTGLGLSVVYGIIHNHGGYLSLETKLNRGSTFKLFFPPNEKVLSEVDEMPNENDEAPLGQGQHILVVDDDPIMAEYLEELLKIYDYQVTVANEAEKALELILNPDNEFDLLVTDQTMPGMTGLELIKQVKLCQPELAIILCSGFSEQIDDTKDEMDICYFSKPIQTDEFLLKVASLIE